MAQKLNAAKRRVWTERLRRFARCDLTVAEFCEAEGVSPPSFYDWRRKLSRPNAVGSSLANGSARRAFLPVQIVAPRSAAASVEIHLPNGVRVSLTNADAHSTAAAIAAAAHVPGSAHDQEDLA